MDIKIEDNTENEGTKFIIIEGKYQVISDSQFEDYHELGRLIHIQYNKHIPLEQSKYNEIKLLLKDVIGIRKYGVITLDVYLTNKNNVITIHCERLIQGGIAGGFFTESSPDYIISGIDKTLQDIKDLQKLVGYEIDFYKEDVK